jgi:ribosome-binding ATPase YchF (GTP1/OBG family)
MKIGIFGFNNASFGKENIVDTRLETIKQMAHSAKKAYIQVELVVDTQRLKECSGIIATKDKQTDLILTDLEFVEKRITNTQEDKERNLLNRFKQQLESEQFLSELQLSEEENIIASGYSLLSCKPVFLVETQDLEDRTKILISAYTHFGYISFFTANEKETHAWPIRKGINCWQASGLIHSDIQKGFIRAEVITFNDLVEDGGINQARANNHLRLEGKDYIVQDGDLIKFRFSK